jgi:hypothetical protein
MNDTGEDIVRNRRQLLPEEKYQIFIEATMAKAKGNGSITEVMRRWGTVNLFYPPDGQAREFSVMRK